jgi:hypothetical protein
MRVTSPSCSTRSTLACAAGDMSPISSRNSVPRVGLLELARRGPARAGERALHVAEQLALDELDGMAAQFTSTNGFAARGECLWMARATSSLPVPFSPGDEHARRRGRHLLDLVEQRADRGTTADDLVAALDRLAQPRVLGARGHALERVAQQHEDAVGVERLLEDVVGAELRGLDGVLMVRGR